MYRKEGWSGEYFDREAVAEKYCEDILEFLRSTSVGIVKEGAIRKEPSGGSV